MYLYKSFIKNLIRKSGRFIQHASSNIIKRFFDPSAHIFFGYYDITPFSHDDEIMLACRVPLNSYKNSDTMDLGYYDYHNDEIIFVKFGQTKAWCWQMGPRLRWFSSDNKYVSYNSVISISESWLLSKVW